MDIDSVVTLLFKIGAWIFAFTFCSALLHSVIYLIGQIKISIKTNTGQRLEKIKWLLIDVSFLFGSLFLMIISILLAVVISIY